MSPLRSLIHSPPLFRTWTRSLKQKSVPRGATVNARFQQPQIGPSSSTYDNRVVMAPPEVAGEPVAFNGRQHRAVKEGLAQILAPYREAKTPLQESSSAKQKKAHNNDEGDQAVFYNPIQQYNRDLSVLAIRVFGEGCVVEKQERLEKKAKAFKQRKCNKPEFNGTKRKVSELDDAKGEDAEKRAKVDDDNEGTLVVEQLSGKSTNGTTQTLLTTKAPKDEAESQANEKQTPFTILDALSASGLRAIRYAKEIPFATNIVANDLSPEAVKSIELNIDHNGVKGKVHSNVGDARAYMYSKVGNETQRPSDSYVHRFDVIDLDPYGTAAPFLDAAVQALGDGGMLCVTCTDAGVFASNGYPEKAYALYGGVTMKGSHSHEAGLRLILHAVATSAAKYGIAIEPLLSLSIDFYARLFIRVHKKQHEVKLLAGTTMITYSCDFGCGAITTQPIARNQSKIDKTGGTFFKHSFAQGPNASQLCEYCGSKMHMGGPMWGGPLHNPYFIQRILDQLPNADTSIYGTTDRIRGMLTLAIEEDLTLASSNATATSVEGTKKVDPVDPRIIPRLPPHAVDEAPFFFLPANLAKVLHCATPPEDPLRGAIRRLGYKVTRSHCKPGSFKTNTPWDVIWELMREWIRQEAPIKEGKLTPGTAGWHIMNKTRDTEKKKIHDLLQDMNRAIEKGVESKEDSRRLLESALYRLEHGVESPVAESSPTQNGSERRRSSSESRDLSKLDIVFDAQLGREKPRGKLVRYQLNPRANWGPMSRAGGN